MAWRDLKTNLQLEDVDKRIDTKLGQIISGNGNGLSQTPSQNIQAIVSKILAIMGESSWTSPDSNISRLNSNYSSLSTRISSISNKFGVVDLIHNNTDGHITLNGVLMNWGHKHFGSSWPGSDSGVANQSITFPESFAQDDYAIFLTNSILGGTGGSSSSIKYNGNCIKSRSTSGFTYDLGFPITGPSGYKGVFFFAVGMA